MDNEPHTTVEVVYATVKRQTVIRLQVPVGTTVREVIEASGILEKFPDIDMRKSGVGIFGQRVALTRVVNDDERVEIYRPLLADPKQVRREKASKKSKV